MLPPSLSSPALTPLAHGFFGREGGVSTGIYDSLNSGVGSQDNPAAITENRRRIAEVVGAASLVTVKQIHSAKVVTVTAPISLDDRPEADALVSATSGIALGILTADCVPILFADIPKGVIGAAHAGWKGAFGGVIENTLAAMEALGAARASLTATIGPCIAQASYQVDKAFHHARLQEDAKSAAFFCPDAEQPATHFRFDLAGYALHRLNRAGIAQADNLNQDTYSQPSRYFSYRRSCHQNEPDYGRQISAIALPD